MSWFNLESIPDAALPLLYVAASAAIKRFVASSIDECHVVPRRAQLVGRVTRLNIYPVKSFDGMHVDEAECTSTGLKLIDDELFDRYSRVVCFKRCSLMLAKSLRECYVL